MKPMNTRWVSRHAEKSHAHVFPVIACFPDGKVFTPVCRHRARPSTAWKWKGHKKMMERTLAIIKPDGVSRGLIGEVIGRLEKAGFRFLAMKMLHLSKKQAQHFYAEHEGRSFYNGLIDFMISGPSVVIVLEADGVISKYRKMMGATDPENAAQGTLRKDFATDGRRNVVHGSDSQESAQFEIGFFFGARELLPG
jgi:nucleoside-diphosphate kinase